MKLENCKIDPRNYPRLSKTEISILEGLIFPYAEFGGYDFIINSKEYLSKMTKDQKKELFILIDEKKSHQSSQILTYSNEKEIIDFYSLFDYDSSLINIINGFSNIRKEKEIEEARILKLIDIKENIHEIILNYVDENLESIVDKYQAKEDLSIPEIKLAFYKKIKRLVSNLDSSSKMEIDSLIENRLLDLT